MADDLIPMLAQFGPAGLIGLLWLAERRHAATRERELTEAHRKLLAGAQANSAMLAVIRENTRAIATLEQTQRQLIELAQGMLRGQMQKAPARQA